LTEPREHTYPQILRKTPKGKVILYIYMLIMRQTRTVI